VSCFLFLEALGAWRVGITDFGIDKILENALFAPECQDSTRQNWEEWPCLLAKQQNTLGGESEES
jgi:hypothetical protein